MRLIFGGFDPNTATRKTGRLEAPVGETETGWASTAEGKTADDLLFDPLEARQLRERVLARLFTGHPANAQTIGRDRILERLGSGAMGVVYAAYDEKLDRKVTLELLRSANDATEGRHRMLREAKALAQLLHPNVVQVHDAGELDGEVFVAMEHIAGPTLREWCEQTPRSTPDILAKFLDAGRGLAAAHDERIVHRDFKPDKVLIGSDGRARVVDFGLAAEPEATPKNLAEASPSPLAPGVDPNRCRPRDAGVHGTRAVRRRRRRRPRRSVRIRGRAVGGPVRPAPTRGQDPARARGCDRLSRTAAP